MWSALPMTAAVCVQHCQDNSFSYAGTEWGGECYCGNELTDGTVQAADGDCSKSCVGDANTVCGGAGRLNLYKLKDGMANPGPGKMLPTTPDAAFPAPTDGWDALGCWFDPVIPRALSGARFTSDALTPALCAQGCASRGFAYAGAEVGAECYCGNEVLAAMKVNATDCTAPCKGDANSMCGAAGRLNLYHLAAAGGPTSGNSGSDEDIAPSNSTTSSAANSTPTGRPHRGHHHHQWRRSYSRRRLAA